VVEIPEGEFHYVLLRRFNVYL